MSHENLSDEMHDAIKRIRDAAMLWTIKAQIPEAGVFGVIAQDADWLNDQIESLQALRSSFPQKEGGIHGPFGWLNGCRGLSEDSWTLESDPLENNDEYFAIPLYALVDPFKETK